MTNPNHHNQTPEYWQGVALDRLAKADFDTCTGEADQGHGPCGWFQDWADGYCAAGHLIEFAPEDDSCQYPLTAQEAHL